MSFQAPPYSEASPVKQYAEVALGYVEDTADLGGGDVIELAQQETRSLRPRQALEAAPEDADEAGLGRRAARGLDAGGGRRLGTTRCLSRGRA